MEYKISDDGKILVNVDYLASFFNRDARTIQLWASEQGMPKEEHGVYDFVACSKWKYLKQLEEIEILKNSGDEKLHDLKMEHQKMINIQTKLKIRQQLNELIDLDAVRIAWVGEMKVLRKALNALVPKLDAALEGVTDRVKRREIIAREIRAVLMMISENLKIETEEELQSFEQFENEVTDLFNDNITNE